SSIAHEVAARVSGEDGVEIRTRLAPSAIIEADETDMRRVIGNLVENARKYGQSKQDGISRITLETRVSHARVELSVSDEGPGIPEDQLPLVMRPFYRVDTARTKADGT
ncbi:sensor histidine kinase, partial [Burkholderia cenocepacia]